MGPVKGPRPRKGCRPVQGFERSVVFSVFGRDIVANCEGNASVKARVDEALPSGHGGVWEGSL